jgi:hypothetical protein
LCDTQRVAQLQNAKLLASLRDQSHIAGADRIVNPKVLADRPLPPLSTDIC